MHPIQFGGIEDHVHCLLRRTCRPRAGEDRATDQGRFIRLDTRDVSATSGLRLARRLRGVHREQAKRPRCRGIHPKPAGAPPDKVISRGIRFLPATARDRIRRALRLGLRRRYATHDDFATLIPWDKSHGYRRNVATRQVLSGRRDAMTVTVGFQPTERQSPVLPFLPTWSYNAVSAGS